MSRALPWDKDEAERKRKERQKKIDEGEEVPEEESPEVAKERVVNLVTEAAEVVLKQQDKKFNWEVRQKSFWWCILVENEFFVPQIDFQPSFEG